MTLFAITAIRHTYSDMKILCLDCKLGVQGLGCHDPRLEAQALHDLERHSTMKITGQTTLAQLDIERAMLGITCLAVRIGPHGVLRFVTALVDDGPPIHGSGITDAEAIEDVFKQRRQQIAAQLLAGSSR